MNTDDQHVRDRAANKATIRKSALFLSQHWNPWNPSIVQPHIFLRSTLM